ncbi:MULTISPECIES: arabinofuranosyltransferase [unclassified Blastococcus]
MVRGPGPDRPAGAAAVDTGPATVDPGPAAAPAAPAADAPAADAPAAPSGEEAPASASARRRPAGSRVVLVPWLAAPVLLAAGYPLLPAASDLRAQYQISVLVLVTAPLLAWLLTRGSALAHHTAAALVAALLPAMTLVALHGTDWYFSGPAGDQSFRLEYATRFTDDLALADYTYADVPAFYSPGWFWVVGLAARATGLAGWQAYKWVAVATLYLAAVVAFALWRRTCGTRGSAALLAVTVVGLPSMDYDWLWSQTLLFAGAYEPYAWLIVLPAPALLAWFGASGGGWSWRRGAALGVAIGVAAWLYVLYALVLALAAAVVGLLRRREGRLLEVAVAGVVSVVLVTPWLGPFLVRWLQAGLPTADALTWIEPDDSYGRVLSAAASPWLLLAVAGAVALMAADTAAHRRLRGLQALAVTVLALGVVQAVAGQAGRGVLFHRLLLVLGVTLLAAGVLALAVLAPRLRAALAGREVLRRPHRVLVAVLTVLFFVGLSGHAREWLSDETAIALHRQAQDTPYPDGSLPQAAGPDARPASAEDPAVDDLHAALRATAAEAGRDGPGPVLTDDVPLLATTPLHGYQQWWALYANPLGAYPERRAFLEGLQDLPDGEVLARLRTTPDAPTAFALALDENDPGSVVYASTDWDPSVGGSVEWSIRLPLSLLEGPQFASTRVGTWVVAVLRPGA